jgi:hypothetical protein
MARMLEDGEEATGRIELAHVEHEVLQGGHGIYRGCQRILLEEGEEFDQHGQLRVPCTYSDAPPHEATATRVCGECSLGWAQHKGIAKPGAYRDSELMEHKPRAWGPHGVPYQEHELSISEKHRCRCGAPLAYPNAADERNVTAPGMSVCLRALKGEVPFTEVHVHNWILKGDHRTGQDETPNKPAHDAFPWAFYKCEALCPANRPWRSCPAAAVRPSSRTSRRTLAAPSKTCCRP